jgi:hypothetical protein
VRYRLKSVFSLVFAAAIILTIGQTSGFWVSAGLAVAIATIVWALYSKKRGVFSAIRCAAGLAALATSWFLGVDRSEFIEDCPSCHSGKYIEQIRVLGFAVSSNIREFTSTIACALADLGTPCHHVKLERAHLQRHWGLLVCAYPCWNGTWNLSGDGAYTVLVSARVRAAGRRDPTLGPRLYRRVIDQGDWRYFWEAFMDDQMAPAWINAPNTREALSWLQGSSDADYRSLWRDKTTSESTKWIQDAYANGATKVYAVKIQPYEWDQRRAVDHILIELPGDANLRAGLFQWLVKQYKNPLDRPQDHGQSYIDFWR